MFVLKREREEEQKKRNGMERGDEAESDILGLVGEDEDGKGGE